MSKRDFALKDVQDDLFWSTISNEVITSNYDNPFLFNDCFPMVRELKSVIVSSSTVPRLLRVFCVFAVLGELGKENLRSVPPLMVFRR